MKIKIIANHKYIDEIQTIAQLFFPHARFCYGDEAADYTIVSNIDEKSLMDQPFYLTKKRLVMLNLFHELKESIGAFTPWGALTGVRPTKMVREWMAADYTHTQAKEILQNTFHVQEDRAQLAVDVAHAENQVAERIHGNGLYVSIPFCPSRCVYCSFNTAHKPWSIELQTRYVNALISECRELPQENISSIYIGGGTPTALADHLLEQLLEALPPINGEFTVEAGRPDTITRSNLRLMKKYGVNRISINPQTLNNKTLKAIGRNHTSTDFIRVFKLARRQGFTCINTDIIAGLPGENEKDMVNTMEFLSALSPENITIHTLAIKRASKLNEERMEQAHYHDKAIIAAQLKIAHESCVAQGLVPYYLYRQKNMAALFENTGYSLPGQECQYNVGMMAELQTIHGIGAGAVSKYVVGAKITRAFNPKDPEIYIERRNPQ
ncbi:MAG: coproporphyrinogen dehydrogenase HemZ [Defluviitaleaceae bacterium]|nr:coproporphyrinogen dehydrogenase HemZ [Defluviitaleaceae bacterium]